MSGEKQVIEIKSGLNVDQIPEATCDICDGPTKRVYLEQGFNAAGVRLRTTDVPGYQCPDCGSSYSFEGQIALFTSAREYLQTRGESAAVASMNAAIEHTRSGFVQYQESLKKKQGGTAASCARA